MNAPKTPSAFWGFFFLNFFSIMLAFSLHNQGTEAGIDEAGRGCLAGPVVSACVILPQNFDIGILNDSKKLTEKQRTNAEKAIKAQSIWAIGCIDNHRIDEINILNATFEAMHLAILGLNAQPDLFVIDGNRFKTKLNITYSCQIKGDARFAHVAAASILAKTHRDALMQEADKAHSLYNWAKNKGYGTLEHRKTIAAHGFSPLHRQTFAWNKGL